MIDDLSKRLVKLDLQQRDNEDEIKRLQKELKKITSAQDNLIKLAEKTGNIDSVASRLQEIEKDKRSVEGKLRLLSYNRPPITEKDVKKWLYSFKDKNIDDEETRREFVRLFVKKVKADPEGFEISLNLSPVNVQTSEKGSRFVTSGDPLGA